VVIARHLEDREEFKLSIPDLIALGTKPFFANWMWEEGAGGPLTKEGGICET
jgi:hypothetical protein